MSWLDHDVTTAALCWRLDRRDGVSLGFGELLRGRRGSDGAIGGHAAGERFLLLERAALLPLELGLAALGAVVTVQAQAAAEATAAADTLVVTGRALRPPAPVALAAARLGDGTVRLSWTRRSRLGWAWVDGTDAPLGEDGELYRLTLAGAGAAPRTVEPAAPVFDYLPADQAADGWVPGLPLDVTVVQLGTRAASAPPAAARFTF